MANGAYQLFAFSRETLLTYLVIAGGHLRAVIFFSFRKPHAALVRYRTTVEVTCVATLVRSHVMAVPYSIGLVRGSLLSAGIVVWRPSAMSWDPHCSARTRIAKGFPARRSQEGHVCPPSLIINLRFCNRSRPATASFLALFCFSVLFVLFFAFT